MKKMKIMLLSFVLLTIVGGALAFKASGTRLYCTAPVNVGAPAGGLCTFDQSNNKTCPFDVISKFDAGGDSYCWTDPVNLDDDPQDIKECTTPSEAVICGTTTRLIGE
jgi:hypothetical protein